MIVNLLVLSGTLLALVMGVRALTRVDALAAFFLYQGALGVADLITLGLRGQRRAEVWPVISAGLWLVALAYVSYRGEPWWALAAVAAASALAVCHRPDIGLFGIVTAPVSVALIVVALLRGEPFPWGYIAVLLLMMALFGWRSTRQRRDRASAR